MFGIERRFKVLKYLLNFPCPMWLQYFYILDSKYMIREQMIMEKTARSQPKCKSTSSVDLGEYHYFRSTIRENYNVSCGDTNIKISNKKLVRLMVSSWYMIWYGYIHIILFDHITCIIHIRIWIQCNLENIPRIYENGRQ